MQKIVNGIAILSGVVSLSLIGGGVYLLVNKDAVITKVKSYATEEIQKTLSKKLPSLTPLYQRQQVYQYQLLKWN